MKSVSQHLFSLAPRADIPRSKFVQPSNYKTAFDSGYLIPFYCDEALPGDTFVGSFTAFGRLSTPVVPFMDNLYLDFHFFAVPNRLLWDNWIRMMGERRDPGDSIDYLFPLSLPLSPMIRTTPAVSLSVLFMTTLVFLRMFPTFHSRPCGLAPIT